jgi:mono/diheme cytochrome c family protein
MRRRFSAIVFATMATVAFGLASSSQQPNAEQRQQIAEANKLKSQASAQILGRKYEEAATTIGQLQDAIEKLKGSGLSDKDPAIATLQKFVESQKKILERNKPKESPKKGESGTNSTGATPAGGVSFVKDVAPILSRNCQRCHGQTNSRSKFNLSTYSNLMKGGEKGNDDIVPGKPDESRLVLMLKGEEEPRMPQGGRALRRELIGRVETWVRQGAKFDGAPKFTPNSTLAEMVPTEEEERKAKVAAMTDSELIDLQRALAKEHWAAANPSKTPETIETEHFIIVGTLPANELEQAGQWAEAAVKDLNRIFGRSKDGVWRGKLTIHLFAERHEYTEHAAVVESRDVPRDVFGHYYTLVETSYAALPKPSDDSPASFKGLVIEQVAGAYLVAQGDTPGWFNTGVGRVLASRTDPRSEIYREYRQRVRDLVADADPVAVLFDGKGGADPGVVGFGLVDFLVTLRTGDKGLANLAAELRKKTAGDKAIQTVYGLDKRTLAGNWTQFAMKKYPAAKKRDGR